MHWPLIQSFCNRKNFLLACLSEFAGPILRTRLRKVGSPTSPASWRKALLLGANHIGDVLYRTSSLKQLQAGLPQCELHFLAENPASQLLVSNPAISRVHSFDVSISRNSPEYAFLAAENYDAFICYNSGGYISQLNLAVNLAIPNRIAYVHKGFSSWATFPISIRYPQPFPAYFRDLVAEITGIKDRSPLLPKVYPSRQNHSDADALFSALGITAHEKLLAAFVTTRQPTGVWPCDRYAEAIHILEARHPNLVTLLMGAPEDASLLSGLKERHHLRARVVAGKLSLPALVCFLGRCKAVLTTDSGPRHLANAAGTIPVFFRNLWFNPVEAGKYLTSEIDIAPQNIGPLHPSQQDKYFNMITPYDAASAVATIVAP